jgi:general secretion pathway protein C
VTPDFAIRARTRRIPSTRSRSDFLQALPLWVAAALGIALLLEIYRDVLRFRPGQSAQHTMTRASGPASSGGETAGRAHGADGIQVAAILGAHLFGAPAAVDSPVTDSSLVLAGVMAWNDQSRGFAIIGQSAQLARLYAVGAQLPNGAHLRSVYPDHVVLERDGALTMLLLPRRWTGNPPPDLAVLADDSHSTTETPLQHQLRQLPDRAPVFGGIIQSEPVVTENGAFAGIRLVSGHGGLSAMADVGLEPGDVVKSVNNRSVENPAAAGAAMESLMGDTVAHVTVQRNNRELQLTLDPAKILPADR